MKQLKLAPLALAGLLGLTACADQAPTPLTAPEGPALSSSSAAGTYIVSSASRLRSGLAATAARNGDRVLYLNEAAGFALIQTSQPAAYGAFGDVLQDAVATWIDKDATHRESLALAGNPPTSGDDDFFFDLQWGHDAVNAPEAWAAGQRGQGVRVAVLDDGIDSDHPDLAPNLNVALSTSFVPGETFEYDSGHPTDPFSHGSHVAGTIAAADNGYGAIGVAPAAELVMVKVLSSYTGSGSFGGVMAGMIYASTPEARGGAGADIINMSLGAYFPKRIAQGFHAVLGRAANYAHQQGTTIIAAAGNSAVDMTHDADGIFVPAENQHIISVAALGPNGWGRDPSTSLDLLASYSNFGQGGIDFAAPGGNYDLFFSEGRTPCTVLGLTRPCYAFDMVFSTGSAGRWYWGAGTSMASPHAAGIAALIIGENGGSMHPAQVQHQMRRRAADLGKAGYDDVYGQGRVTSGY